MRDNEPLIPKHGGYRKLKSFQLAELIFDITVRFCDRYIDPSSRTRDQMVQAARSGTQNIVEGSQFSGTSKKTEMKLTGVARSSLEELRRDYEDFLRQRGYEQFSPDHPALVRFKARRCATLGEFEAWIKEERNRARQEGGGEHGQTRTHTDSNLAQCQGAAQDQGANQGANQDQDQDQTQAPAPRNDQPRRQAAAPAASEPTPVPVRVGPCQSVSSPARPCVRPVSSAALAANGALSLLNLCAYLLDRQLAAQADTFETEGGFTERLYHRRIQRRGGE